MPRWRVHKFQALPSTNTYARELLAHGGAEEGEVFQVEHQTAGRGRFGERTWLDEAGESLLVSIVLTEVERSFVSLAPFVVALALSTSIRELLALERSSESPAEVMMKWPNDILLDAKKCSGILCEAVWTGEQLCGIVLGIGLNVNQTDFAGALKEQASSLRSVTGRTFEIDAVRDKILMHLAGLMDLRHDMETAEFEHTILERSRMEFQWMASLPPFQIEFLDGRALKGLTYAGIATDGALILRDSAGNCTNFYSGSLNLRAGDSEERNTI